MPKLKYRDQKFKDTSLYKIQLVNAIVDEYAAQGFVMTLRQVYYQMVARDHIPNNQKSYDNLGELITNARYAGLIDWGQITDRTRAVEISAAWDTPADLIQAAANQYREDLWFDQDRIVEVWIEKDALKGVVAGVCDELRIPLFSCRGYVSASEMWGAAVRIINRQTRKVETIAGDQVARPQATLILHLGDHDPSGIDMTGDIERRLTEFCEGHGADAPVIRRIALNMTQVEHYRPPENPVKLSDGRAGGYMARFGVHSWELDALSPAVLAGLIRTNWEQEIDSARWETAKAAESANRDSLLAVSEDWEWVEDAIGERQP